MSILTWIGRDVNSQFIGRVFRLPFGKKTTTEEHTYMCPNLNNISLVDIVVFIKNRTQTNELTYHGNNNKEVFMKKYKIKNIMSA